MSLYVIRAFVKVREELTANSAIMRRLAQIDNTLFLHDSALRDLYQKPRLSILDSPFSILYPLLAAPACPS
jgi:hypothetical protein